VRPKVSRSLAVAALLVSLAACGDDDGPDRADDTTTTTTTSAPSGPATPSTTTTVPASAGDLGAVGLALREVARLDQPIAMAVRPGHAPLYVAERDGRVAVLDGRPERLIDISSDVSSGGERGLLGMAFSPDGARLYLSYTNRSGDSRLVEWTMGADARSIDLGSRREVLAVEQPASNHNGGGILFGPDGLLWYGLGDGGGSGDRFGNAQNLGTILGSILRIDPASRGGAPYTSPAGNPFGATGGRAEIAVYGVRNPWRFSFDRATGDLWVGDVGQNRLEEVDRLPAGRILGANLGWPIREGTRPYDGSAAPPGLVDPVWEYGRTDGQSVVGGYVYRGRAVPALAGAYVFTDTYVPTIRLLAVDPDGGVRHLATGVTVPGGMPASFGEDAAGELYVLSLAGGVYRIESR
jgi:glucose/arabinose dehydrogenase